MALFTFVLSGDESLWVCRRAVDCVGDNRACRREGKHNYLLCYRIIHLTELSPQQNLPCASKGKDLKLFYLKDKSGYFLNIFIVHTMINQQLIQLISVIDVERAWYSVFLPSLIVQKLLNTHQWDHWCVFIHCCTGRNFSLWTWALWFVHSSLVYSLNPRLKIAQIAPFSPVCIKFRAQLFQQIIESTIY